MNNTKLIIALGLMCWCLSPVFGQQAIVDSLQKRYAKIALAQKDSGAVKPIQKVDSLKKTNRFSYKIVPKKATLYSIIPGGGQIYNRQYWKAPFVWAAFGVVGFFIDYNNKRYQDFVVPYIASFSETGVKIREKADVFIRSQNLTRELTLQQITQGKDFYRRNRDLSIIGIVGVFALAAVEANVSAHLQDYNEFMSNDNLSLRIEPDAFNSTLTGSVVGVKVVMAFK
jgi:hypothetical protein